MPENESKVVALKPKNDLPRRVIFADFAVMKFNTLIQWLKRDGIEAEAVTDPPVFLQRIQEEHFDIAVINLLLGGIGPFELVRNIRQASKNAEIRIIVVSRQVHKLNIQNTMRAGANDFVGEPFENADIYQRLLYHLAPKKEISPTGYESAAPDAESWEYLRLLLEATELLSRTERHNEHSAFLTILRKVADLIGSNRTSLIIVESETNTGIVLASSDDPNFYDFPISLHKYPEILHVLNSGNFVLIDDVSQNALTNQINDKVKTILIGSVMVFPVRFQGDVMGVLTVRRPKAAELPSMNVMRVLQAIANTMAAHSNIKALLRKIYRDYDSQQAK